MLLDFVVSRSQLEHDGCCVCLFVSSLFSVTSPFNEELLVKENCCVCCIKLF